MGNAGSLQRRKQVMQNFSKLIGRSEQKESQQTESQKEVEKSPSPTPSPSPPRRRIARQQAAHPEEPAEARKPDKLKGTNLNIEQTVLSKLVFTGAIINIAITSFVLGSSPKYFHVLFSFKVTSLQLFWVAIVAVIAVVAGYAYLYRLIQFIIFFSPK